ncbi:ABC transporter substrate-binding protein [Paenibacillus sp. Soil750]|uniref:ABC transporter substrate-binding protein n=1 Tax=Paenibacillus sp. Soil750 TaxID=1736398 RepID=UPI0006F2E939|nr:sugar ABC transporter substrate-binding protein [Paenibacillus sp. Soil750]KRE70432.1 sugar ABC transporter substrate-binding protein [Paenibacillus sp. Soil750]
MVKKMGLSMVLGMMVVVSACGGDGTAVQTTDKGTAKPDAGTKEKVTLTYGTWGAAADKSTTKVIEMFNSAHPNIEVKLETTPNKQYWQKLETAAIGETLPDLFWMNGPNIVKYGSNGILMPITDLIKSNALDMSKYPKALVDLYTVNGKNYGVPKDFDTPGLWYNKALFDAAGVKYPDATWDWNSVAEAAKKLTDPAKGVWGIAATLDNQSGYYDTILQAGGYIISEDKKSSGYDKPEAIAGLKFWTDLINVQKVSPTMAQMTDTEGLDMFKAGKVAMIAEGDWNAADFAATDYLKGKFDVAPLPKNKKSAVIIHGLGNVISAKTKHPKEAAEFLKFLGSKEAAEVYASQGTVIPAYEGTQDTWVKSIPGVNLQVFIDQLKIAVPYPVSKNTSAWASEEAKIFTKAWAGAISAEEAGKQMAALMNEKLAAEK